MSLSAHDRHVLDAMQAQLAGSDPGLSRLMSMFSRLTAGEDMPVREQFRTRRQAPKAMGGRGRGAARPPSLAPSARPGRPGLLRLLMLGWLLVTVVLICLAVALGSAAPAPCRSAASIGCTQPPPAASVHPGS